ncbi:dihydrolipoamide dehydrogenase [Sinobaca qinghaiensis]|uniref:Dihydrolipoyl dehydrogenase n=1 Tax=Sinobaca qinghaiensis TaxID=342944 RepID=A0A419V7T5_9BACL|nr:dihydrolipoyl dehydrogenase [Sinobaca qinghaiensis]RKD76186.1 dihydrolipoamide dehydrogenase [Sinobaca qinghaiensis]
MQTYDIVIVGGGPGGYTAASRAAALGKKTALVEAADLGGTCLNRGCIPSKTYLRHAEAYREVLHAGQFGIETGEIRFSYDSMLKRKNDVIQTLRGGVASLMKAGKIDVMAGWGTIHPDLTVSVESAGTKTVIQGKKIIAAMGSTPAVPPIKGIEQASYHTSDTIFDMDRMPERLTIIGAGYIGVEFASIYAAFGVEVTLVEMADRIIPLEDSDAGDELKRTLLDQNVTILTNTAVEEIKDGTNTVINKDGSRSVLEADVLLISTGRRANLQALKELDLEKDGPYVRTNKAMQTSHPDIYAIGDLAGGWQLAHAASAEGTIAAEHASGRTPNINMQLIPRCIYTYPEVASVGFSEAELLKEGRAYKTSRTPLRINGKSLTAGNTKGFMKLFSDEKYGEILGAVLVGPHVTEMIAEPEAFMQLEGTLEEWKAMVHPHPTLSESLHDTAVSLLNKL